MGVGGNERSISGARRNEDTMLVIRELRCEMPISLWRILLPRLYSAESVRENLLWGIGRRARAGLVGLEKVGSSFTQSWSWEGSS